MKKLIITSIFLFSGASHGLINGKPLVGHTDLVQLQFSNGWKCTGLFIDQYTILTAAHCIAVKLNAPFELVSIVSSSNQVISVRVKEYIVHPKYRAQLWPSYDIGVIKTERYQAFAGNFILETEEENYFGKIRMFGTGRTDLSSEIYGRSVGENNYLKVGSVLFFGGRSKIQADTANCFATVAPNDSGGPVVEKRTGAIIGVMTTTTATTSLSLGLPTLSTATSTVSKSNLAFLLKNMGLFESLQH